MSKSKSKTSARRSIKSTASRKQAQARPRVFKGTEIIVPVASENPRRPGTVQHERFAQIVRLCRGKKCTVDTLLEKGVDRDALVYAFKQKHVKVAKSA